KTNRQLMQFGEHFSTIVGIFGRPVTGTYISVLHSFTQPKEKDNPKAVLACKAIVKPPLALQLLQ
ncbi:MAG TPA: hypothetical protein VN887_05750, partial [Candidatus Angelobacter sp.]|nr:hypothetical protein [Candidatus Angelobacter sp.]